MSPQRAPKSKRTTPMHWLRWLVVLVMLAAAGWFAWVRHQIIATANIDNAQPADAIAVFGAAEYAGRPSPVLHARLDKAVSLYNKGIATVVVTLGGSGGNKDSGNTEAGVGRDYLLANGVPFDHIIAETESIDTEQQVHLLAGIAREHHFQHIVVSDGTHLFRIALLCQRAGLDVYTSPRAVLGHIDALDAGERMMHEVLSYTFLRFNLHISWLHRWLESKIG